jgi:probable HAF family extracellular repeat protein
MSDFNSQVTHGLNVPDSTIFAMSSEHSLLGRPSSSGHHVSGAYVPKIDQTYYGNSGDDSVTLGHGNNIVYAGEGRNIVETGSGNDTLYGGASSDVFYAGDGINIIYAGEGRNVIETGSGNDTLYGGADADIIRAGDGVNTIYAGEGRNSIFSGLGSDTIYVGASDDLIYSGAGDDLIYAGEGNNVVSTGTGYDNLYIGSGADQITLSAGEGAVTVMGFNAQKDTLQLGGGVSRNSITFTVQNGDTVVKSGDDLLAVLKWTTATSQVLSSGVASGLYQATDLGSVAPNALIRANAINDFGQVVGRTENGGTVSVPAATPGGTPTVRNTAQGFLWEAGVLTLLPDTGVKTGSSDLGAADGASVYMFGGGGVVAAINNQGLVVGTGDEIAGKSTDRGLLWQESGGGNYKLSIYDFGGVESYFFDVNRYGEVAGRHIYEGFSSTPPVSARSRPVYWADGVKTDLAALGGDTGTANGLNDLGQIVGQIDADGVINNVTANTAALWQRNATGVYELTNLGTFGAEQSVAQDINQAGQIIGWTTTGSGATARNSPFLLQNGQKIELGSFGGTGQTADINELGQVVGYSRNNDGVDQAFVWSNGVLSNLNQLVKTPLMVDGAPVTLTRATSINSFGDVTAYGTYSYKDAAGTAQTGTRSYLLARAPM